MPRHKCAHCPAYFAKPTLLNRHMVTHTGERAVPCLVPGCVARFSRRDHLARHIRGVHSGERHLRCSHEGCSAAYYEHGHLARHEETHARPNRKRARAAIGYAGSDAGPDRALPRSFVDGGVGALSASDSEEDAWATFDDDARVPPPQDADVPLIPVSAADLPFAPDVTAALAAALAQSCSIPGCTAVFDDARQSRSHMRLIHGGGVRVACPLGCTARLPAARRTAIAKHLLVCPRAASAGVGEGAGAGAGAGADTTAAGLVSVDASSNATDTPQNNGADAAEGAGELSFFLTAALGRFEQQQGRLLSGFSSVAASAQRSRAWSLASLAAH